MLERIAAFLREAASKTAGSGLSSTKLVWLSNGMLSCYCATLATIGGVSVYVWLQEADPIYWTAVGALWVNALGFASSVQRNSHNVAKEITIAQNGTSPAGAPAEGGRA